jgi:WD40 repeat protein
MDRGQSEPAGQTAKLKLFISYSREDVAFADQLASALRLCGFEPFVDRHSMAGGEEWQRRLGNLIVDADTIVFILSPASAASEICGWEVTEAVRLSKRILPVLCRPLQGAPAPPALRELNYIHFYPEPALPGSGFGQGLTDLVTALNTDLGWLREHTRLLQRAHDWIAAGRTPNRMLSGSDIAAAKAWVSARPTSAPAPTELHLEYLRASELDEDARQNAERQKLEEIATAQTERGRALQLAEEVTRKRARLRMGAFVAISLVASLAGWQWWRALDANIKVVSERDRAEQQRGAAETARKAEKTARETAERERTVAVDLRTRQLLRAATLRIEAGDAAGAINLALEAVPLGNGDAAPALPAGVAGVLDAGLRKLHETVVYRGHDGPVRKARFTADGRRVLTTGDGGKVIVFDAATGRQIRAFGLETETSGVEWRDFWLGEHDRYVGALGGRLGQHERAPIWLAAVWDVETGELVREFGGAEGTKLVRPIAGTTRVLVATQGEGTSSIDIPSGAAVQLGTDGVISDDGRRLVRRPGCELVDTVSGRTLGRLGEGKQCGGVLFEGSGAYVIVRDEDNQAATIFRSSNAEQIARLTDAGGLGGLTISDDGSILALSHAIQANDDGSTRNRDQVLHASGEPYQQRIEFFEVGRDLKRVSLFQKTGNRQRVTPDPSGIRSHYMFSSDYGNGTAPSFSPDGTVAAFAPSGGDGLLWDTRKGEIIVADVGLGAFSHDGALYATISGEAIEVYRVSSGERIARMSGHRHKINSIVFSPDGKKLLTSSIDRTARLWVIEPSLLTVRDVGAHPEIAAFAATKDYGREPIYDLEFSCDAKRLIFSHNYGSSTLYDVEAGTPVALIKHGRQTGSGFFAGCDHFLVPAWADGRSELRIFDAHTGKKLGAYQAPDGRVIGGYASRDWRITGDGKYVLARESKGGVIHIWDGHDQSLIRSLDTPGLGDYARLRINPLGTRVAATDKDGRTIVFEIPSGRTVGELPKGPSSLIWSQDGSRILRDDGIWHVESGNRALAFAVDPGCGEVRSWSEAAHLVAFSLEDSRNFCLYDDTSGKLAWANDGRNESAAHKRSVVQVSFAAEGKSVVTGSTDETARLWDAKSGSLIAVLGTPLKEQDGVEIRTGGTQIDFTSDRKLVVTGHERQPGGEPNVIRAWDAATGGQLAEIRHNLRVLSSLQIDGDGKWIAAADQDGRVLLWERIVDSAQLLVRARQDVPRCLDQVERAEFGLDDTQPEWCLKYRKWPYGHYRTGISLQLKPGEPGYARGTEELPTEGVKINNVIRHLPADQAGIKVGDLILAINGKATNLSGEVLAAIAALLPAQPAEFKILRDGRQLVLNVLPQD